MRHKLKWLDIPSMSQGNPLNSSSNVWCGRTSASMVFNYYQRVRGKGDQLIVNQTSKAPYNLVRPDGTLACSGPGSEYYLFAQVEVTGAGWKSECRYPVAGRSGTVTESKMLEILAPVLGGLDKNNPAVIFTSISSTDANPRHIVVISGYRVDERGELWVLIDDPATVKKERLGAANVDLVGPPGGPSLMAGTWQAIGARYWLRAMRLFELNTQSAAPWDLFCDHGDSPGCLVYCNDSLDTPESPYSHVGASYYFPLPAGVEEGRPKPQRVTAESAAEYFERTEKHDKGGYFPLGTNTTWHGGVHLFAERGSLCLPGFAGEIVAVRLREGDKGEGAYGSRNFILVKHALSSADLSHVEELREHYGYRVEKDLEWTAADGRKVPLLAGDVLVLDGAPDKVKIESLVSALARVTAYFVRTNPSKLDDVVELRRGASSQSSVILNMVNGDEVDILDRTSDDWHKVKLRKLADRLEIPKGLRVAKSSRVRFVASNGTQVDLVENDELSYASAQVYGGHTAQVYLKSLVAGSVSVAWKVKKGGAKLFSPDLARALCTLEENGALQRDHTRIAVAVGQTWYEPVILKSTRIPMVDLPGCVARSALTETQSKTRAELYGALLPCFLNRGDKGEIHDRSKRLDALTADVVPTGTKRAEKYGGLVGDDGYVNYKALKGKLMPLGDDRNDYYAAHRGKSGTIVLGAERLKNTYVLGKTYNKALAGKVFYSLFMHVNNEALDKDNEELHRIPWLCTDEVAELEVTADLVPFCGKPDISATKLLLRRGDVLTVLKSQYIEGGDGRFHHVKIKKVEPGGDIHGLEVKEDGIVLLSAAGKSGDWLLRLVKGDKLELVGTDAPLQTDEGPFVQVRVASLVDQQEPVRFRRSRADSVTLWPELQYKNAITQVLPGDVVEIDRARRSGILSKYVYYKVTVVEIAGANKSRQRFVGRTGWVAMEIVDAEGRPSDGGYFEPISTASRVEQYADRATAVGWVAWRAAGLEPALAGGARAVSGDLVGYEIQGEGAALLLEASTKAKVVFHLEKGDKLSLVKPDKPQVRTSEGRWAEVRLDALGDQLERVRFAVSVPAGDQLNLWSQDFAKKTRLASGDVIELAASLEVKELAGSGYAYAKVSFVRPADTRPATWKAPEPGAAGWVARFVLRKGVPVDAGYLSPLDEGAKPRAELHKDNLGKTGWLLLSGGASPLREADPSPGELEGREGYVRCDVAALRDIPGLNARLLRQIKELELPAGSLHPHIIKYDVARGYLPFKEGPSAGSKTKLMLRVGDQLSVVAQAAGAEGGRWDKVTLAKIAPGLEYAGHTVVRDFVPLWGAQNPSGAPLFVLRAGDRISLVDPDATGGVRQVRIEELADVAEGLLFTPTGIETLYFWKKGFSGTLDYGVVPKYVLAMVPDDVLAVKTGKSGGWLYYPMKLIHVPRRTQPAHVGKQGLVCRFDLSKENDIVNRGYLRQLDVVDDPLGAALDKLGVARDTAKSRREVYAAKVGAVGWVKWQQEAFKPIVCDEDRSALHGGELGSEGFVLHDKSVLIDVYKPDDGTRGEVVRLEGVKVGADQPLWTIGAFGRPGAWVGLVHWEIFSEEALWSCIQWRQEDDPDDNYSMDCKGILEALKIKDLDPGEGLSDGMVVDLYQNNAEAKVLRKCQCRFVSEWGIDVDKAVDALKGSGLLKARMRPYPFWKDAEKSKVGLPRDPHVWHYNPVAFVALFDD